jgi:hypothetical protein
MTNDASIRISAVDSTSPAFRSIIQNLEQTQSRILGISSAFSSFQTVAATLGVTLSAGAFAGFIKSTVDMQDQLFKMSQKTGIAADALYGLKQGADLSDVSIEQLEKTLVKLNSIAFSAASGDKGVIGSLKSLKINVDEFSKSQPEERIYLLARALESFGDEDKGVMLTQLLGDKMAYLTPLLAQGEKNLRDLTKASRESGVVTNESAQAAEFFNDQLTLLQKSAVEAGTSIGNQIVPALNIAIQRFKDARKEGSLLQSVFAAIKSGVLERPLDLSNPGKSLNSNKEEYARQLDELQRLRKEADDIQRGNPLASQIPGSSSKEALTSIQSDIKARIERIDVLKREMVVYSNAILKKQEAAAERKKLESASNAASQGAKEDELANRRNQAAKEALSQAKQIQQSKDRYLESLDLEILKLSEGEDSLKKFEATKLGFSNQELESINQKIASIDRLKQAEKDADESRKAHQDRISEASKSFENSISPAQKFQSELTRLNQLYQQGYFSLNEYRQVIAHLSVDYSESAKAAQRAFGDAEQFAIQAARNIQSTFANALGNLLSGRGGDFGEQFRNLFAQISGEFISRNVLGNIVNSLDARNNLFQFQNQGGFAASQVFDYLGSNNPGKSLGESFISTTKKGFSNIFNSSDGLVNNLSKGIRSAGNSVVSGFKNITGMFSGSSATGAGASTGMSGGLGAAAAPLMAAFVATSVFRNFAGDKKLGGGFGKALNTIGDLPIIGDFLPVIPLLNSLFGRGPYKLKQRNFSGEIDPAGELEARIHDSFKSKGGLFSGNKWKGITNDLDDVLDAQLESNVKEFKKGINEVAEVLGISSEAAKQFKTSFDIKLDFENEDKAKQQIEDLFNSFGDSMTQMVMPSITELRKGGETLYESFVRIGQNFKSILDSSVIFNVSLKDARDALNSFGHAALDSFIGLFDSVEQFSSLSATYENEFLSIEQRKIRQREQLNEELTKLGLSTTLTRTQFTGLIESFGRVGGISAEMLASLLKIAPLFDTVADSIGDTVNSLTESVSTLDDLKSQLRQAYNDRFNEIENTKNTFKSILESLKQFKQSLTQGNLSPLTPQQKLDDARTTLNRTLLAARAGDSDAIEKFPQVAEDFLAASQVFNASSAAYQSDFNIILGLNEEMQQLAKGQISKADQELKALKDQVSLLIDIDDGIVSLEDAIRELTKAMQQGAGNSKISDQEIRDVINNPNLSNSQKVDLANKFGISDSQILKAVPSLTQKDIDSARVVSDKQILDFVNANQGNLRAIYDASIANGVSRFRLSHVTGWKVEDIEKWTRDNNLAMFKTGTDLVPRDGMAFLHKGEAVVNSSVPGLIERLIKSVELLITENRATASDSIRATVASSIQNAQAIVEGFKSQSKTDQYFSQSFQIAGVRY